MCTWNCVCINIDQSIDLPTFCPSIYPIVCNEFSCCVPRARGAKFAQLKMADECASPN
jgi:hypothetical protein